MIALNNKKRFTHFEAVVRSLQWLSIIAGFSWRLRWQGSQGQWRFHKAIQELRVRFRRVLKQLWLIVDGRRTGTCRCILRRWQTLLFIVWALHHSICCWFVKIQDEWICLTFVLAPLIWHLKILMFSFLCLLFRFFTLIVALCRCFRTIRKHSKNWWLRQSLEICIFTQLKMISGFDRAQKNNRWDEKS